MWQVGLAELKVRVRPVRGKDVDWYVRHELEEGTEVDYLEAEASRVQGQGRHSMLRAVRDVGRAVLSALRGRYVEAQ